jgi:hypothetical protein
MTTCSLQRKLIELIAKTHESCRSEMEMDRLEKKIGPNDDLTRAFHDRCLIMLTLEAAKLNGVVLDFSDAVRIVLSVKTGLIVFGSGRISPDAKKILRLVIDLVSVRVDENAVVLRQIGMLEYTTACFWKFRSGSGAQDLHLLVAEIRKRMFAFGKCACGDPCPCSLVA